MEFFRSKSTSFAHVLGYLIQHSQEKRVRNSPLPPPIPIPALRRDLPLEHPPAVEHRVRLEVAPLEPPVRLADRAVLVRGVVERRARVQHAPVVEQHRVALPERVRKRGVGLVQERGEAREGGVECGRRRHGERCLEGGREVDELHGLVVELVWRARVEFDGGVFVMQVVVVVDVVEGDESLGKDVEVGGMGLSEAICSVQSVDKYRGTALYTIP